MPEDFPEDADEQPRSKRPTSPEDQAKEKTAEFRQNAELAAVFEGTRKFNAELRTDFDADTAREIQRTIGRLSKLKVPETPVLNPEGAAAAVEVLNTPTALDLATNDYHVYRRPGEVMIARWVAGDEVDQFYQRFQAHFDATMSGYREEQQSELAWKQDGKTQAYLEALEKAKFDVEQWYLREPIKTNNLFVLSTFTGDMNILFLTDMIMERPVEDVVGQASAPPDNPSDADLTWFFKLFALRGVVEGVERMCFVLYLQKSEEDAW